ncbi:uncharacterized protein Dvir_GJ17142 [Drosophila virilis]|uniref:Uncharacterized protein n=1 Tax=Drosophila virilis TaxID=7244 RepID=B4LF61_DROVI|nr:uncharacterized protein LOC6624204 [Drosophila virilis]EDW70249.1 uncharacterized protein Dvir_GJ17142 [Drosophila virilis]
MHRTWARAEQFRSCKESHEIFPREPPQARHNAFIPSFDKEQPSIGLLLGWEYGRLWLKEHKESMDKELSETKPYFIEPDFGWWVNKRTTVLDRRQIFLKKKQNPHFKNCNLSAFANSKTHRKKHTSSSNANSSAAPGSEQAGLVATGLDHAGTVSDGAARMTDAEKRKICKCKDCKQRRCGGQEKYKLLSEIRKSVPIPWY